jgi:hypothetical protein
VILDPWRCWMKVTTHMVAMVKYRASTRSDSVRYYPTIRHHPAFYATTSQMFCRLLLVKPLVWYAMHYWSIYTRLYMIHDHLLTCLLQSSLQVHRYFWMSAGGLMRYESLLFWEGSWEGEICMQSVCMTSPGMLTSQWVRARGCHKLLTFWCTWSLHLVLQLLDLRHRGLVPT